MKVSNAFTNAFDLPGKIPSKGVNVNLSTVRPATFDTDLVETKKYSQDSKLDDQKLQSFSSSNLRNKLN